MIVIDRLRLVSKSHYFFGSLPVSRLAMIVSSPNLAFFHREDL